MDGFNAIHGKFTLKTSRMVACVNEDNNIEYIQSVEIEMVDGRL